MFNYLILHNGSFIHNVEKRLCKKLDIPIDKVILFGDSTNDLLIIVQEGMGIAMGNALKELKEKL